MILKANSSEFAQLVEAWLADNATLEQVAQLWLCVQQCPECARELAAASRFEELLAETVKVRQVESEARQVISEVKHKTHTRTAIMSQRRTALPAPWLVVAALLIIAGIIAALLWPEGHSSEKNLVRVGRTAAVNRGAQPKKQPSSSEPLPVPLSLEPAVPKAEVVPEVPLTERLEAFFLTQVNLSHVPLSQALAQLQKDLLDLNDPQSLDLTALTIKVPLGANSRPVSFTCGPIPFLKAVRAVAGLAGCDVEVTGSEILLRMQTGIYPHLDENRLLTDLLAGRINPDGTAMVDDARRVEELWQDAVSLGIEIQENGTAAVSRGQWEALRMVSEARDQVALLPTPAFAVYLVPNSGADQTHLLMPHEVAAYTQKVASQRLQPVATLKPALPSTANPDPLVIQPSGETFTFKLNPKIAVADPALTQTSPLQPNVLSSTSSDKGSANARSALPSLMGTGALITAPDLKSLETTGDVSPSFSFLIIPVMPTNP